MRVWGRVPNANGGKTWVEVSTDANGNNDAVNVTWLAQVLKLNLGESPFYAGWGIPQQQTIMTQVLPDYYLNYIQKQFSNLFASLSITFTTMTPNPTYKVSILTNSGANIGVSIALTADSSLTVDSPILLAGGSRPAVPV